MVEIIPPPDPQALLPPLLACLPTAFASSRPPPAFLSLLSPILRQRVQYLPSSPHDNWLRMLCWDSDKGERLKEHVEEAQFEPHPVSGEIEVGDVDPIRYKRFDSETLRAQVCLPEWSLTSLYLWCTEGEDQNAWRLDQLVPYDEDLRRDSSWSTTIQAANESSNERLVNEAMLQVNQQASRKASSTGDDDDYWAMYDGTPGRTPATKRSPVPNANRPTEADYYAQYNHVQPALDNHDPSEEGGDFGESSLNGNALNEMLARHSEHVHSQHPPAYQAPLDIPRLDTESYRDVSQPIPASPSSRGSDAVSRLEEKAEAYAASEVAVRQHIGTTMKSMYRLARSTGMDREEFERIVQRELETLSIFERDD